MSRHYLSLKETYKILAVIAVIYTFCWYVVGQYVKNNITETLKHQIGVEDVSCEKIDLYGFPFRFSLDVERLKVLTRYDGKSVTLFTKEASFSSDVILKNFEFDFNRKIYVHSDDNKVNYVLKIHQDANIDFGVTRSILRKIVFQPNLKVFMRNFSYFDSGYDIMDRNTGRIIAASRYNKVFINKDYNKIRRESKYTVKADIHSELGEEDKFEEYGDNRLNMDIVYSFVDPPKGSDSKGEFALNIKKINLISDDYFVRSKGSIEQNLDTRNASGKMETTIEGLDRFLEVCNIFMSKTKVKRLEKILINMSSRPKKSSNIKNLFFTVSGNSHGIRYGNIGALHRLIAMMNPEELKFSK